jgi:hypothetical protein
MILFRAPYAFQVAWKMIQPWLSKETADKIVFTQDLSDLDELVGKEIRTAEHGGTLEGEYPLVFWKPEFNPTG